MCMSLLYLAAVRQKTAALGQIQDKDKVSLGMSVTCLVLLQFWALEADVLCRLVYVREVSISSGTHPEPFLPPKGTNTDTPATIRPHWLCCHDALALALSHCHIWCVLCSPMLFVYQVYLPVLLPFVSIDPASSRYGTHPPSVLQVPQG